MHLIGRVAGSLRLLQACGTSNRLLQFASTTPTSGTVTTVKLPLPSPIPDFVYDPIVDPTCNPEKPVKINFSDISTAAFNIRDGIKHTACSKSHQLSELLGVELYLKKEYLQVTGSFKERGARFALMRLTPDEKQRGVIAARQEDRVQPKPSS